MDRRSRMMGEVAETDKKKEKNEDKRPRRGPQAQAAKDYEKDTQQLNGGALLSMLKAHVPTISRYTKEELLSIGQLPASRARPQDLCSLIDRTNLQSPLLIRAKAEKVVKEDESRRSVLTADKTGHDTAADGGKKRELWDTPNLQPTQDPHIDLASVTLGDIRKVEQEMAALGSSNLDDYKNWSKTPLEFNPPAPYMLTELDIFGPAPYQTPGGDRLLVGSGNVFCDEESVEESRGFGKWFNNAPKAPEKAPEDQENLDEGTKVSVADLFSSASGRTDLPAIPPGVEESNRVPSPPNADAMQFGMKGGKFGVPAYGMKGPPMGGKGAVPLGWPPYASPTLLPGHGYDIGVPPPNYYAPTYYINEGPPDYVLSKDKGKGKGMKDAMWQERNYYYAATAAAAAAAGVPPYSTPFAPYPPPGAYPLYLGNPSGEETESSCNQS
eukprot:GEMP01034518.1.p1 GENE.GEMP01034518.1~~GEMP01034518.1.p1  ORF type:complete len:440 (+),score=111.36 GEMP01034518.1:67-1386(+)